MHIGILHTAYLERGGEDLVAESEQQLLQTADEVTVTRLSFVNPAGKIKKMIQALLMPFNPASFLRTYRWLLKEKPDVLHVHNWHYAATPAVFIAARMLKIPVVHTVHNYRLLCPSGTLFANGRLFTESLNGKFPWKAIQEKVYRNSRAQSFMLAFTVWLHSKLGTWKKINRIICLTEFQRSLLVKQAIVPEEHTCIKPNFTEAAISGPTDNRPAGALVYVGRLTEEKGVNLLLQLLPLLKQPLVFYGTGQLQSAVSDACENHPLAAYRGYGEKKEIKQVLQKADVLLFPSLWFEGMPMIILESFAAGTPVIASRLGAMTSLIADGVNGFFAEPGDAGSFHEAIQRWNNLSGEEKNTMRRSAQNTWLQHYTPAANLNRLLEIYRKVNRMDNCMPASGKALPA